MVEVSHIIVVENPKSSSVHSARKYVRFIRESCPDASLEFVPFSGDLHTALAGKLKKGTLLGVAGGDGTVSSVIGTILGNDFSAAERRTPILPLWGGNANDLAHMFNGAPSQTSCKRLMNKGNAIPIYPLRCDITFADGAKKTRFAVGYASFGATAQVAHALNTPKFRKNPIHALPGGKVISEAALGLKALHDSPTFTIEHKGERKVVYDWIIAKGSRMARIGHLPVELTDEAFYQGIVERKRLPDVVARVADMAWGRLPPSNSKEPISFMATEPIWSQFDGEPLHLPANTRLKIALSSRPFYALATMLKPRAAIIKA